MKTELDEENFLELINGKTGNTEFFQDFKGHPK